MINRKRPAKRSAMSDEQLERLRAVVGNLECIDVHDDYACVHAVLGDAYGLFVHLYGRREIESYVATWLLGNQTVVYVNCHGGVDDIFEGGGVLWMNGFAWMPSGVDFGRLFISFLSNVVNIHEVVSLAVMDVIANYARTRFCVDTFNLVAFNVIGL